jgi:hypothetical protein
MLPRQHHYHRLAELVLIEDVCLYVVAQNSLGQPHPPGHPSKDPLAALITVRGLTAKFDFVVDILKLELKLELVQVWLVLIGPESTEKLELSVVRLA